MSTNFLLQDPSPSLLGAELRGARKFRRVSQRAAAEQAGVDLATLANLENGKGTVSPLLAVMDALGLRFTFQDDGAHLGAVLHRARRALRLSQECLSDLTGLSRPTLIQLERGRGHIDSLCRCLAALGLPTALRFVESPAAIRAPDPVRIHVGDCLTMLGTFDANSVQTCITSPPYFQQRDYGVAGQIGLEASPTEYVERLVAAFREVSRVLRKDGTLWLNLGDTFARTASPGLSVSPKDLMGLPWRIAFALQESGWYLRQDIVIQKSNPMPEPVRDRCVRAHEYLFLFSKSKRYHFDANAIRERGVTTNPGSPQRDTRETHGAVSNGNGGLNAAKERLRRELQEQGFVTRHKRSVWAVTGPANRGGHFAAFPEQMVEPCILAGCPEGEVVLDPFAGTGTTGRVAQRLNRRAELIEINPQYAQMAARRCASTSPISETSVP